MTDQCGTDNGYAAHHAAGQKSCPRCVMAHARAARTPADQVSARNLHERIEDQMSDEAAARATRLAVGIRDEQWGSPWWLVRPQEATT